MEFRDLSEVCAWAEWAAFNRFTDVLKNLIIVLRERGIKFDENTIIQKRLTFVGYDRMNTAGDDLNLEQSLHTLEQLRRTYQPKCTSPETTEFQFLRMRQMTLMQTSIAMLYNQLQMTIGEPPPEDPRKIELPPSFSLQRFSKDVEELLKNSKIYHSQVMLSKIEDEFLKNTFSIVVEVFDADDEGKISKERVKIAAHYLLHQYPFQQFTSTINAFSRKVERVALPAPTISPETAAAFGPLFSGATDLAPVPPYASASAASASHRSSVPAVSALPASTVATVYDKDDWSETARNNKGPYASPPAATTPTVHIKTSSSVKKLAKRVAKSPPAATVAQNDDEDTDEQCEDEVFEPAGKRTRSSSRLSDERVKQVITTLRETNKVFRATNRAKDPLQEALDIPRGGRSGAGRGAMSAATSKQSRATDSPGRVSSVVGGKSRRLRKNARKVEEEEEDIDDSDDDIEEHAEKIATPVQQHAAEKTKKKTMTSARASATAVQFSDGEDGEEESRISRTRALLEVSKQEFTPTLHQAPRTAVAGGSPSGGHTNMNRTRWTSDEEDALLQGVERYGTSGWAHIRDDPELRHRFNKRTNMNLKDKYRNLQRKGVVDN